MPDKGQRTLLGFDFGSKKIGVAVGQEITATASPLKTLPAIQNQPDWKSIGEMIEAWQAEALVVGLPYNMDGSEQEMTRLARQFGRQLQGRFHMPVYYADERLSTVEAQDRLRYSTSRKKKAYPADAIAAQIILQTFFSQEIKHSGKENHKQKTSTLSSD